jgi:hypothetical protein
MLRAGVGRGTADVRVNAKLWLQVEIRSMIAGGGVEESQSTFFWIPDRKSFSTDSFSTRLSSSCSPVCGGLCGEEE